MVERPIFVPLPEVTGLVEGVTFSIPWHTGSAPGQNKKNIRELHDAAAAAGYAPLLEVSTQSDDRLGRQVSAFHLMVDSGRFGEIPLECAFQGSKLFERGGPFTDLFRVDARAAKRDPRLRESGKLAGFLFDGFHFESEPKTAFYDWLYVGALLRQRDRLTCLDRYAGFTDIAFNPSKSINCQARSCALFVSLMRHSLLNVDAISPQAFAKLVWKD